MNPIVNRVALRYARRTIRFDTRAIELVGMDLAEKAIEKLLKTLPADSGIEWELDRNEVLARHDFVLEDVRGQRKAIRVFVKHRALGNDRPTAGGTFSPESGEVALYLNSRWSPQQLAAERYKVQGTFASFLVHEVTHALDVLPEGEYEGADGQQATYYNQPAEFRAYSKQIVADVLARWKMTRRRFPKLTGAALVEAALGGSPNYEKVAEHFDRRNQQRLRLMVVRELEDAGLL